MRCPYCDKYVLKNEIECPNCHNNLILAWNKYGGEGQYRSRFKLIMKFVLSGDAGSYLRWLGYNQEANENNKKAMNTSHDLMGGVMGGFLNPANLINPLINFFSFMISHTIDFLLIVIGIKYKYDAYGHPVCYIDPNKKLNRNQQKKINFADIAFIESNNLKSFSESEFINSLDAGSNGIAVTNAQGLTGNTAEAGVGLAGSTVEAGAGLTGSTAEAEVGLTGNTAEAGVGLAGNTAEVGIELAGSTAEAGLEASKTEVGVGLTSMVEAKVGLTESEAETGVGLAESAAEKETRLAESTGEEKCNIQKNNVSRQVKKCSNCGSINDIDAVYCNKCGRKLLEEKYTKSDSAAYKKYAFILVVLLILCFGSITVVKSFSGPEQVAKNYISAINKGDYKEAYKYLDVEEGSFINSDLYVQQMHTLDNNPKLYGNLPYEEIRSSSVQIEDIKTSKQNDNSIYEYQAIGRNNAIMKVKVKKYKGIIFDDYKVIPDNVYRSLTIEVDDLAKVYVDNILLTEKEKTDHSTNIFTVKHIFAGKHSLKVERPLCKPYDESLELDTVNLEKRNVSGKAMLTEDVIKQLNLDTEKLQRKVIECALRNKEFTALDYNLKYPDKLQDMYVKYKRFFNRNDGSGIYDLKINKVSSDTKFDSLPYNPFKGRLSKIYFEFEYTRKNRNGMQESRIGRGEGYLTALYEYQNEKLVLVSVVNYQLKTH
ncbi:hypothetical protein [Phascolarctobacterium succinatutens]|uniref:hypothetical protein n=1 Tax=Phascolarctobacterium succinatutens TaxID=626940 RepID=UPI0026EF9337|nr:hypothetical protein [Phascolarctobacterium succinatutens]